MNKENELMSGILGNVFDFNHDGKLDAFERAAGFSFMDSLMASEYDKTEFELTGLDADKLECMDIDERRKTLEDAGLDPDDYDF
jgi:hypothetical protein